MGDKRKLLDRVQSGFVRENLRPLIRQSGLSLEGVCKLGPSAGQKARYARLWWCMERGRRFCLDDVHTLAVGLRAELHELLCDPNSTRTYRQLDHYEPVLRFIAGVEQAKFQSRAKLITLVSQHRGNGLNGFWDWPGAGLSEAQQKAISRHPRADKDPIRKILRAEAQAENLRQAWQLGLGPIPSLRWVLLRAGVVVCGVDMQPMRPATAAISGTVMNERFVGLTGRFAGLPWEEKRLQLAVQLGRLFLTDRTGDAEHALPFARAFLMPRECESYIQQTECSPRMLRVIAKLYGVGPDVLGQRLEDWRLVEGRRKQANKSAVLGEREPTQGPWAEQDGGLWGDAE